MTVDPNEEARFKSALAKLTLDEIQQRLDGSIIARAWKRDLAEAEGSRRDRETGATDKRSQRVATNEELRKRNLSQRVWALVGIAIVAAVALIWTMFPR